MVVFVAAAVALSPSCTGEVLGGGSDDDRALPPCDNSLSLAPDGMRVPPGGLLVLSAAGGDSGVFEFTVTDNQTGGRVNRNTGVYLAGDTAGVDRVTVRDAECRGSASVSVNVTDDLVLVPATVEVPPGGQVRFDVMGGTGDYELLVARNESGGTIDATGLYGAGTVDGQDLVRVRDRATDDTAEALVDVVTGAVLRPEHATVHMPLGSTFEIVMGGGSGYVDAAVRGAAVTVDGAVLTGAAAGTATVDLTDRYTAQTTSLAASVLAPHTGPSVRYGARSEYNAIVGPGDLNGDGEPDAVLAMPGATVTRHRQGAVFVYAGDGAGLAAAPAQVLTGPRRSDELGRSVAVADLDGDGQPDLVVGAPSADITGTNTGAVYVYPGVVDGFFEEEPTLTLFGPNTYDLFGAAVATCDFDADGDLDLAVGLRDAEDRDREPRTDQQGAIHLYLNDTGAFRRAPDLVIDGEVPDGAGGFAGHRNLRVGNRLAAGDFDGDGACDLAAHAENPRSDRTGGGGDYNDGGVLLYRGVAAVDGFGGGLRTRPSLVWASGDDPEDRTSRLGQWIAMGDLDGDGLADIAASEHLHDVADETDAGALYVFRGRALGDTDAARIGVRSDADWSAEGADGSNYRGQHVRIADLSGDGQLDLLSGDPRVTPMDSELSRPGVVRMYRGRAGSMPDPTPTVEYVGLADNDRFGQFFDVIGNADGRGGPDLLVLANYGDDYGPDAGTPYFVSGDETLTPAPLELPGSASGRRLGDSVAVVGDVTGDGLPDLLAGAPDVDRDSGGDYGTAVLYRGTATGFETTPALEVSGFAAHSSGDRFGETVAPAGDFDGDGVADFAVVARYDDRPSDFDPAVYAPTAACAGSQSNPGALFVFRGTSSGLPSTTPAFVYYGPYGGRGMENVAGGFDFDGDGLDDLVVGDGNWDGGGQRGGGFAIVRGMAADPGGLTVVICDAAHVIDGDDDGDELGFALTALGDLDGDGCDEIAAGARRAEPDGGSDEGQVMVAFGFGGLGCPATTPEIVRFDSRSRSARAGSALAGGVDLDGDGVGDLVVGAPNYRNGRGEVGRVYVVTGAYVLASRGSTGLLPLADQSASANLVLDGRDAGERRGTAVAAVPATAGGGGPSVAAGAPYAAIAGPPNTGGTVFYGFGAAGFAQRPWTVVGGETNQPYGLLGGALAVGRLGTRTVVAVGADWSSAQNVDDGTVYTVDLGN